MCLRVTGRTAAPALLATALAATPTWAGSISIAMTPTAQLAGGALTVRLKVSNTGDEAAGSVTPSLYFRGREVRGNGKASLDPNESIEETLSIPAPDIGSGRWPYHVTVDYSDANQYPFQAIHMGAVASGNPPLAKVTVAEIAAPAIARSGTLGIHLRNLADTAHTASVTVLVPQGLSVTQPSQEVSLEAGEEKSVSVPLINRGGLAGSRYPVFVTAEYDDGPVHQALVARGAVDIRSNRPFGGGERSTLWILGTLLVLGWVGFVLTRKRHRSARRKRS